MRSGLSRTFEILAGTDNEAAVRILLAALDSSYVPNRLAAFRALLARRSPAGHREIIRRFEGLPPEWQELARQHAPRLGRALRDAVLSSDARLSQGGCQAAVFFRDYHLIPALLTAVEDRANPFNDRAGRTLLALAEALHAEIAGSGPCEPLRDPRLVRDQVLPALEASVRRFARHHRREVLEAFALLADRDNVVFRQVLNEPHHAAFVPLTEMLGGSDWGGIIRLIIDALEEPAPPAAIISLVSRRGDVKFLRTLLSRIAAHDSPNLLANLKRVRILAWLRGGSAVLDELDETAQEGAVRLAMAASLPRAQAFGVIDHLLRRGKPAARCVAAEALGEFHGAEANALAIAALDDPDPRVQAKVLPHLRHRGIPGALPRLVRLADSPHAVVRTAVGRALEEFHFAPYLAAFDMLNEPVRRSSGALVRKLDPNAAEALEAELKAARRTRRLRGLAVAQALDLVERVEPTLITMLDDPDPEVRSQAAHVLAQCDTPRARAALRALKHHHGNRVQHGEAPDRRAQTRFDHWREVLADPRD